MDLSGKHKRYLLTAGYGLDRQQRRALKLTGELEWAVNFDYKAERSRA